MLTSFTHSAYFSLFPQGAVVSARAHGIDVSKYDKKFTPETAAGQLDFVIQRASYRTTRDEAFASLIEGVMRVGIGGAYHYLNSGSAWKTQADKFLEIVSPYAYHFFACDFEASFNALTLDFAYEAWKWIHYIQDRTGKECLLYTSLNIYKTYITPSAAKFGIDWNSIGLWQAQWFNIPNPNGTPSNPTSRTAGWDLWQYTSKGNGPLYGVTRPTACDLNVFNGTAQQMRSHFKIDEPEPTPGEDDMPITPEQWNQLIEKLGEIGLAIKGISLPDGGSSPPPTNDGRTTYQVTENDPNPNGLVKVYKSPDDNEVNLETLWATLNKVTVFDYWQLIPGHPVWSSFSEADKINTYRDWRAIDCTITHIAYTAGGKAYAFPKDIRYQSGETPKVVWIHKADLGAVTG